MRISWNELGAPQQAGDVRVEGFGVVEVRDDDIKRANEAGGNPSFELQDQTASGDQTRRYLVGLMV